MDWKPKGYNSASPYLIVSDGEATLRFMETVFDAKRLRILHRENGSMQHAEARIDDTVVMLGEAPVSGESLIHIYVPNPDAVFERALAAGASVVQPMSRSDDGDYRGGVSDGNGVQWWIARQETD